MNTYIICLLAFAGIFYYGKSHWNIHFHDTLVYAKKNTNKSIAPKIEYWMGVTYYQKGKYALSQEAFTQLLTDHPTCQYVPKALLGLADAADYNHDWEVAKGALARYVEEYPQGKEIVSARKQLELLRYNHP